MVPQLEWEDSIEPNTIKPPIKGAGKLIEIVEIFFSSFADDTADKVEVELSFVADDSYQIRFSVFREVLMVM